MSHHDPAFDGDRMHMEFIRDKAPAFPIIAAPLKFTSVRVWHCKFKSLEPLSQLKKLQSLIIANYPDRTLELLSGLKNLRTLEILHLPRVASLEPLSQLRNLRRLSLRTLPSWDASGKVTVVDSLAPLTALPNLEELELFGVVPQSRSVDDLIRCRHLTRVRLSKYPEREQQKVHERWGKTDRTLST